MEIRYVNHSVANRFNGYIEINENLKKYPHLLKPILEHELSHTDKAFSWEDFKLDFFSNNNISSWDMFKFMFKHPKSFLQLSPILYSRKKGWIIDFNLLVMFITIIAIFLLTMYIGGKYL